MCKLLSSTLKVTLAIGLVLCASSVIGAPASTAKKSHKPAASSAANKANAARWQKRLATDKSSSAAWQKRLAATKANNAAWQKRIAANKASSAAWQKRLAATKASNAAWQKRLKTIAAEKHKHGAHTLKSHKTT
jgi:hypothetical protein